MSLVAMLLQLNGNDITNQDSLFVIILVSTFSPSLPVSILGNQEYPALFAHPAISAPELSDLHASPLAVGLLQSAKL
jgi:hypothetical protein